jgi:hypothetical protein
MVGVALFVVFGLGLVGIFAKLARDTWKVRNRPIIIQCPNGHQAATHLRSVLGKVPEDELFWSDGNLKPGPFQVPQSHCAICSQ